MCTRRLPLLINRRQTENPSVTNGANRFGAGLQIDAINGRCQIRALKDIVARCFWPGIIALRSARYLVSRLRIIVAFADLAREMVYFEDMF